jgi:drug/metabolite transporter (DMT)-like permease
LTWAPVVALVLGIGLLDENLTTGAVIGMILIALGTWLSTSTRPPQLDPRPAVGGGTDTG